MLSIILLVKPWISVAHITDIYGNVNDGQVQFTVNGVNAGTTNVNNGIATLNWFDSI